MKLKINFKKIMAAFILIMIVGSAFIGNINTVYGKINEYYKPSNEVGTIDLDKASDNSIVLEAIGYFVYAIAGFIESIVGSLIGNFTGEDIFPWADRVIFNTIPFLDVNFLSPSNGSLFRDTSGIDTMFGSIVSKIYYTIFTLAIAFFGVVVGIMALRLAISSIASEKAKYKQAITNWLLALILLFTAHYLISFIFFVNEKMVEVASSILKTQVEENIDKIKLDFSVNQSESSLNNTFNQFFVAYYNGVDDTQEDVYCMYDFENHEYIDFGFDFIKLVTVEDNDDNDDFNYKFFINHSASIKSDATLFQFSGTHTNWDNTNKATTNLDSNLEAIVDNRFKVYLSFLLCDVDYLRHRSELSDLVDSTTGFLHELDLGDQSALRDMRRIVNDALFLTNIDPAVKEARGINIYADTYTYTHFVKVKELEWLFDAEVNYGDDVAKILQNVYEKVNSGNDLSNTEEAASELLSGIANFFKNSMYSVSLNYREEDYVSGEDELIDIEFQPIIAILYAIFVIQSIMYFIAYMKRFFYIVILSMFAPLIIVYDFLMKSAM